MDAENSPTAFSSNPKSVTSRPIPVKLFSLPLANVLLAEIEQQEEALQSAVVIDEEMQESILEDSHNLAAEILDLVKSLEPFSYQEEDIFNIDEYEHFSHSLNFKEYLEHLRQLGNKLHGFKGTSGFIIPVLKTLCHEMEEITLPLVEMGMVLTNNVARLLKQFIFKAQEMLEEYQKDSKTLFNVDDWIEKIKQAIEQGQNYLGSNKDAFKKFIIDRVTDSGEIRHRKKEQFISVSLQGYEKLTQQVRTLFFAFTEHLSRENMLEASGLYNEFLDTHQNIKKIPIDLSRYERLIPSLAGQYGKEADFIFKDHKVRADLEFWNAVHEIVNHSLKNAIVHGLETIEEREAIGKDRTGKITIEISEDALNIFISIGDDGKGINVEKISEMAIQNGLCTTEQIKQMSQEEVLNLVFVQGISTAESLDDNAGRGVGLNAVQEAMRKFNGSCVIQSKLGEGCVWKFVFSKQNVSLPCFIVSIGNFHIAIPEDHVVAFYEYLQSSIVNIKQKLAYRYQDDAIPLVDSQQLFNDSASNGKEQNIMILRIQDYQVGLVFNKIIHYAILPIFPLPRDYGDLPIYVGVTFFRNEPVLVLNPINLI